MSQRFKNIDYIGVALWVFRAIIIALVLYGTINKIFFGAGTQYTAKDWVDFLGSGLSQGSLYALIALGYTMVYGILFMINFAHGEFFMAGGMTSTMFLASALAASGFMNEQPVIHAAASEPLEENMVIALEPKRAIPGVGMVGVENTFVVTPEGGRSVTGHRFDIIEC